jgi:hypothetical protein
MNVKYFLTSWCNKTCIHMQPATVFWSKIFLPFDQYTLVMVGNYIIMGMPSFGMLCCVALVRTNISEECSTPIIRVTRIGELGTTLAVTSNWHMLYVKFCRVCRLLMLFLAHWFFLPWWWRRYVPPKHGFLQEPHGITSQKMAFFIDTAVKT